MGKVIGKAYVAMWRLLGWKIQKAPEGHDPNGIYIVPTHTSLLDGPLGLAYVAVNSLDPLLFLVEKWYDKSPKLSKAVGFFRTPDMDYTAASGYVSFFKSLKKEVKRRKETGQGIVIGICPEGRLAKGDGWKGSFLYLARLLKQNIYVVRVDYNEKYAGVVNPLNPVMVGKRSDKEIMDEIRSLCDANWAKYPENVSPMILESE